MTRAADADTVSGDFVDIPNLFDIARYKIVDGRKFADDLPEDELNNIERAWGLYRRPGQGEPPGDWNVWLMLAGRGFGKTRTGAEWLRDHAARGDVHTRLALVGATAHDVRAVMVEGDSGMLATASDSDRPVWEPTLGRLIWANGAQAYVYSAESPDRLRGPQFHAAWCDELAAWPEATAVATWTNLRFSLRIGARPRLIATTTPRATPFVRDIVARRDTVVTGGRTGENPLLAESFVAAMIDAYAGTPLGRQELDGELIDDRAGALWTRAGIEACRVAAPADVALPRLRRIVVGVDPSGSEPDGFATSGGATTKTRGDACGIVVVGVDGDGVAYVIEDATVPASQGHWTQAVARVSNAHNADCVVAEANYGGAMVGDVLRAADANLPLRLVHATKSKSMRAEPVSLLYARGLVRHAGRFPELEDELCGMMKRAPYAGPGRSPDRADALVWAVGELLLGTPAAEPRVRIL